MASKAKWENRIVEHGEADPASLEPNPQNWRMHPASQAYALEQVLDEVGAVQGVIVNKRTGRLVDGHLRVELAIKRKLKKIPVCYVDLSEQEEKLVLATLDPLAGMAGQDDDVLAGLLGDIREGHEELLEEMGYKTDNKPPVEWDTEESFDIETGRGSVTITYPESMSAKIRELVRALAKDNEGVNVHF